MSFASAHVVSERFSHN